MQRKTGSLPKRIGIRIGLAIGLALILLAAWAARGDALLAMYWESELTTATGEPARQALQRLVSLGRPGLAAAVRAMAISRDHVGQAAYIALNGELDRWIRQPPEEAAAKLGDLADALGDHFALLPQEAQARAANLAMRILLWHRESAVFDGGRLVAACGRVISLSDRQAAPPVKPKPAADSAIGSRIRPRQAAPHTPLPPDRSMYLELSELAPPGLPRADQTRAAASAQPRLLVSTDAGALAAADEHAPAGEEEPFAAANRGAVVAGYAAGENGDAKREPAAEARRRMRGLETLELFGQLNEPGEAPKAASAELTERGFSPRQIDVGKRLSSPDAAERLRWAETLPGIRGIDARFWLLRLSHDVNLQVRRCAVGLLATDRDPEVIRRLREIVAAETDGQLRDQASRALEVLAEP